MKGMLGGAVNMMVIRSPAPAASWTVLFARKTLSFVVVTLLIAWPCVNVWQPRKCFITSGLRPGSSVLSWKHVSWTSKAFLEESHLLAKLLLPHGKMMRSPKHPLQKCRRASWQPFCIVSKCRHSFPKM